MAQKFTVKMDKGRPDNLRESVRIAFTLTPAEPSGSISHPYYPLARGVTDFPVHTAQSVSIEWDWLTIFSNYTVGVNWLCQHSGGPLSPVVLPGQSLTRTPAGWSGPFASINAGQPSITLTNNTGTTHNVLLTHSSGWAIAAYHPLQNGGSITVPSSMKIQAYIVRESIAEYAMLQPEDLTRPLFRVPLNCNDLPASSTWRLCQDSGGRAQLKNDDVIDPGLGALSGNPPGNTREELNEILASLNETQQRLIRLMRNL